MGAAECARRTGLTVRALRVYERLGLIEPTRTAKGWRVYGQQELVRLNAIVALKSLGLSLLQIREVLSGSPMALAQVLRLQIDFWEERKAKSEEGLNLVRATLISLHMQKRLSIEDLCNLAKNMDGSTKVSISQQVMREAINKSISAEEERAWITWWSQRPPELVRTMQEFSARQSALMAEVARLQVSGVDPASAEAHRAAQQWSDNMTRYDIRRVLVDLMSWDPVLTRKWVNLGARVTVDATNTDQADVMKYLRSAVATSPMGQTLSALLEDVKILVASNEPTDGPQAAATARRLEHVCREYELGDALTYAKCTLCMRGRFDPEEDVDPDERAAWLFLIDACASPLLGTVAKEQNGRKV